MDLRNKVRMISRLKLKPSLDPRLLSHAEREPGTHCLRMRHIFVNFSVKDFGDSYVHVGSLR